MYLMCDFGVVKQANKLKKKVWEDSLKLTEKISPRQNRAYNLIDDLERPWSNGTTIRRPFIKRKPKSGESMIGRNKRSDIKYEKKLDPDFTDIRETKDKAASTTGYLGFHKDTYHPNYMTEGEVPMVKTGKKIRVKPKIEY